MKKKTNNKSGFTLGEVLTVMAIVGIVSVLALTTTKPVHKKAVKYLYANAYNSLEKAYYNSLKLGYNPFTEEEFEELTPEHTETADSGAEILCRGLTTYINTGTNVKTADRDYSSTCSSSKLTDELADSFIDENVQFTANNGMKFYISKRLGDVDDPAGFYFYLVFVDINGNKKPNSFEFTYRGNKTLKDYNLSKEEDIKKEREDRIEPDIFAFAIIDSGRVVPLGIPEYDKNIATARLAYFDSEGDPQYASKSVAYYQAKGAAWGYYSSDKNILDYNKEEPFTLNDYIRTKINPKSKLVDDFPVLSTLSPVALEENPPYSCPKDDYENCFVFIDLYRQ